MTRGTRRVIAGCMLLTLAAAVAVQAQNFRGRRVVVLREGAPVHRGAFTFCRLMYDSVRGEAGGQGWSTDYSAAEANYMYRLEEMTHARVTRQNGDFAFTAVRANDPGIYECPFLFASDVGTAGFSPTEAAMLRDYLLKGGFLWVDDFWGEYAWANWAAEISRILPEFEIVDMPMNHALFSTGYAVKRIPQIPSIQFWRQSGGGTSERGYDSAEAHMRAMIDETGRIVVLMSHNTDIADGWEREGEDDRFFFAFSPESYALGINIALWMLTH
jgi:hypothetical protein